MGNFWNDWKELIVLQDYVGDSFFKEKILMQWKGEMLKLKNRRMMIIYWKLCVLYMWEKSVKYN